MIHGGLGHIDEEGVIALPPELLEHSLVGRGGMMYGLYYRRPVADTTDSPYWGISARHDLVLTPIPYYYWSLTGRLKLVMPHRPERIRAVSQFLADRGIAIVHSESARIGFRYEYWSFYIVFDLSLEARAGGPWDEATLPPHPDRTKSDHVPAFGRHEYRAELGAYEDTAAALERLELELINWNDNELGPDEKILFRGPDDSPEFSTPVTTKINFGLAHFHHRLEAMKQEAHAKRGATTSDAHAFSTTWKDEPIEFRSVGRGRLVPDERLPALLRAVEFETGDRFRPGVLFAALDTHYLNYRIALISERRRRRFFEVGINYRRIGGPDQSRGLVAHVTRHLPAHYNIWSSKSRVFVNHPAFERGQMVFVIEDQKVIGSGPDDRTEPSRGRPGDPAVAPDTRPESWQEADDPQSHFVDVARSIVDGLRTDHEANGAYWNARRREDGEPGRIIEFDRPTVRGVTVPGVIGRIGRMIAERGRPDVFISYSLHDADEGERVRDALVSVGLDVHFAGRDDIDGSVFSEDLRAAILGCVEMWVLCSKHSLASRWVQTEWGAAWILQKHIVPVLHGLEFEELPDRLRERQAVRMVDIDEAARRALTRIVSSQLG